MTNHPGRPLLQPRDPAEIGTQLAESRRRAALSQTVLAMMVHAKINTVQQWEAGLRAAPAASLELWGIAAVSEGYLPDDDPFVVKFVRPTILSALRGHRMADSGRPTRIVRMAVEKMLEPEPGSMP